MKKKLISFMLLFAIVIGMLLIPTKTYASETAIQFTGTHFKEYLLKRYPDYDTNKDGEFSQSELDQFTYGIYFYSVGTINIEDFTKEDFENLKYFKNVSTITMDTASFTGEIDLTGLTNLCGLAINKVDQNNLPHFKVNNNLWLYTSPASVWGWDEATQTYKTTYNEEDTANFKMASLWLGGTDTCYAGNDIQLASEDSYSPGGYVIAETYNSITPSDSTIAVAQLPNNWSAYSIYAKKAGTVKFTFTSALSTRTKTFTIKAVSSSFNPDPAYVSGNSAITLFKDGKVLTQNGDLYEVNKSNLKGNMTKINSGISKYIDTFGEAIGGFLKADQLTLCYTKGVWEESEWYPGEYVLASVPSQIQVTGVAQFLNNGFVVMKDNTLRKYYVDTSTGPVYDITYAAVGTNINPNNVNGRFFINTDNKLGYYPDGFSTDFNPITDLSVTTITDSYSNFVQVGNQLYYVYDYENSARYALAYSDFQGFVRSTGGIVYGFRRSSEPEIQNILHFEYESQWGHTTSTYEMGEGLDSFNSSCRYSASNYYSFNTNESLTFGAQNSLQLCDVIQAASIHDDDYNVLGIIALRKDYSVFYQAEPFTPWTRILNMRVFPDVPDNAWYTTAISYVKTKGIMSGYNDGSFGKDDPISRGQIVTMLYRLAGSPDTKGLSNPFTDVPAGKYYTEPIKWAVSKKITTGKTATSFDPNGNVTRQELAVFMARYASYILKKNINSTYNISGIADYKDLSTWAIAPMQYIMEKGVITGDMKLGYARILPKNNATRAEAATMFMRFCQNIIGMT